jgi:L-ascorbate metabolism protein UlaG (beta-lactamase superfamily)
MLRRIWLMLLASSLWLGSLAAGDGEAACRDLHVSRSLMRVASPTEAVIQYFGHNFFQITTGQGTRIVTDPLAPGRYPTPDLTPHVVTVGREHPNHNSVHIVRGQPLILRGLTEYGADWNRISTQVREVSIFTMPIYQHGVVGALKGAAFIFDLGSLCMAHLGDLSHTLTPEQLQQLPRVDVALIPIGGVYTMGPDVAREVLQQLKPKLAIPMHYWGNRALADAFTNGLPTRHLASDTLAVSQLSLPTTTEIAVLKPAGARE